MTVVTVVVVVIGSAGDDEVTDVVASGAGI
jgi:hypothetical protein